MRDLKEYEILAGLTESKKPDQKKLLQFKKKLLTIIKKQGLVKASDYIKDIGNDHGDEYIDPLISYVKFAEAQAVEALQKDVLFESDDEDDLEEKDDDDPCWDGYEMFGMKDKNGKKVPNCVKKESLQLDENKDPYQARNMAAKALEILAKDVRDNSHMIGANPDSDSFNQKTSNKMYDQFMRIVDGVGKMRQIWKKI